MLESLLGFLSRIYSSQAVSNSQEEKIVSPKSSDLPHIAHQEVKVATKQMKRIGNQGMTRSQESYSTEMEITLLATLLKTK